MTIQQLRYVVALDTHKHFVKAAESCFVAQPTLTLQVKKLEKQLDFLIFDRSVTPLQTTPLGGIFVLKARQILREIEQLEELINTEKNEVQGTYRIGIIPSIAPYLLPLFVKSFLAKFPEVKLIIKERQSEQIIEDINHNLLDIGILSTPIEEARIREIPLYYEPFGVYANASSTLLQKKTIAEEDLTTKDLWLLEEGHCFRNQTLRICGKSIEDEANRNLSFEGGSIETLKKMVQDMGGYTLVPQLAIHPSEDTPFIRSFQAPEPAREVSLITHQSFAKETILTELRRAILKDIPKAFKKNSRFITVDWR
jgi:LysR family hydrogen peroxide-inducible transcriptional activator